MARRRPPDRIRGIHGNDPRDHRAGLGRSARGRARGGGQLAVGRVDRPGGRVLRLRRGAARRLVGPPGGTPSQDPVAGCPFPCRRAPRRSGRHFRHAGSPHRPQPPAVARPRTPSPRPHGQTLPRPAGDPDDRQRGAHVRVPPGLPGRDPRGVGHSFPHPGLCHLPGSAARSRDHGRLPPGSPGGLGIPAPVPQGLGGLPQGTRPPGRAVPGRVAQPDPHPPAERGQADRGAAARPG